ncbi:MAG: glycosyltransferase [Spirochaetales bacterium]|nr:glycosyltransferase [Spirochaetales bacterium]
MNISWQFLLLFFSILLGLNLIILLWTLYVKRRSRRLYLNGEKYRSCISDLINGDDFSFGRLKISERVHFLTALQRWTKSFELPDQIYGLLSPLIKDWNLSGIVRKKLKSRRIHVRSEGLLLVELLPQDEQLFLLEKALERETSQLLELKMVEILCSLNLQHSISLIIDVLKRTPAHFRNKIICFLSAYSLQLGAWAARHKDSPDPLIRRLLIIAAEEGQDEWFLPFLTGQIRADDFELRSAAAAILLRKFSRSFDLEHLFTSPYEDMRKKGVEFLIEQDPDAGPEAYLFLLEREDLRSFAVDALSRKVSRSPRLLKESFELFKQSRASEDKLIWAEVLSSRVSYFAFRAEQEDFEDVADLLSRIIELGHYSQIINFLNQNRNQMLEETLKRILLPLIDSHALFRKQCRLYLNEKMQKRWKIPDFEKEVSEPKFLLKRGDKVLMGIMMLLVIFLPIGIFLVTRTAPLRFYTSGELFVSFVFFFHYVFAFYNIAVNSIYFILMLLSWYVINRQQTCWELADRKFLFTPGLLPSISILAPAFNEETTIIQNVYSLMALDYADFEVIVIDDGSSDKTSQVLINQFNMEISEWPSVGAIACAPVQGVYRSREYPGLLLIRKLNGGKADALNAGINYASGEYICSIDADSLLEPDALQKIMIRTLIHRNETVAVGGNVLPSNGSIVSEGMIREIHLPENTYARYQTVEYLRSFISNRLGWSKINSLLVISGAFGVFKRDRIVAMGGYLTGKGKLRKDTVGEDMEAVVHLYEYMKDSKRRFHVDYAYNANCWTEVPETLESLVRQRDRWHRGLVEVILYHKNMLFNRKYGAVGLIAFPYFVLFELLGPFLESMGYLLLIIPFFLGLLNSRIILFMFSIAVVLGILISTLSLFLAEKGVLYFKGRDFRYVVLTAFLENFGWRQFISFLRPVSYFMYTFRRKDKGWQKFQRKGFLQAHEKEVHHGSPS